MSVGNPPPSSEANGRCAAWAGGYKSGAYQVGVYIRLNELGVLKKLKRIASVSDGSTAMAFLGLRWKHLVWQGDIATNFHDVYVEPMTELFTSRSIDVQNIRMGLLPGRTGAQGIEQPRRRP